MHPWSRRAIERTPERFRRPAALVVRTGDAAMRDRLPGLAAEIAFWVLLSLPALVLTAIAAAGVILEGAGWQDQLIERTREVARVALTETTIRETVVPLLERLVKDADFRLLSTAAAAAVWTASRAVRVVLSTLAIVYGKENHRPGWQDRLLGFGVTLGAVVAGIVVAPLLVAGPAFGENLEGWTTIDLDPLPAIWSALYWPTMVVVAALLLAVLYHFGVPGRTRWLRALPGAIVATGVWLAGSAGLRLYGMWIAAGESVYGSLAGPVVVMLWLWLSGFAVLLGGELNAQFDVVWPRQDRDAEAEHLTTDEPADLADDATPADVEDALRADAPAETTRPINAPTEPRT